MINSIPRHHHNPGYADDNTTNPLDTIDETATATTNTDVAAPADTDVAAPLSTAASTTAGGTSAASSTSTGGLVIDISYDSSVTALQTSDPTLYNDYTNAVQTAVKFYESEITNPITVTIDFGWGEVAGGSIESGAIGESRWEYYTNYTYSQVRAALAATDTTSPVQTAAVASLPATDPTGGASFGINTAEAEALGLTSAGATGSVGLDSSASWSWTQSSIASGSYDAVGVLEHEVSEVLGRDASNGSGGVYYPLDLFRYTAANGLGTDAPGSPAGARDEPFQAGYSASAYSYFSYNGSTVTLEYDTPAAVANGDDVGDWASSAGNDSYDGASPSGVVNSISSTDLEEMNVLGYDLVCYLRGTRILTPTGEVLVENLNIGDLVVTRFSGIQPIKWIGRQSYDSRFIRANRAHLPVCIQAAALAEHIPARDLYVSPGHSMLVDGQLVLACSLVNGITITQVVSPAEIHYFQIELETHDCVIAEGAWSETFADGPGLRDKFHNAAEFAKLYPDHPPASELLLCASRPEHGPKLDAVLQPVVARAATSLTPGPLRGYIDGIETPWAIVGWAQDTDHPELPVLLEVLVGDQVIATTLACDHRQDLQDAGIGQGRSAFFLTSPIRLRPEMLPSLRVRRASDRAEIQMTPECRAKIEAMQQAQTTPDLRRVA